LAIQWAVVACALSSQRPPTFLDDGLWLNSTMT
jgi:hypothetical protein